MTANEVARLLAAADAANAAGQRDTAFAHLESALNLDPANPRILNSLGLRALHGGDGARAVALLERATAADPEASPLWYNLSTAHRATGDSDAQLLALDACLTRDPYMLRALLAKGQLLERRGDATGAVAAYTGLLKASPPDAELPPPLAQAVDHARDGIRVNAVLPGYIDTPMARQRLTEQELAERVGRHPIGRLGRPEDVAADPAESAHGVPGEARRCEVRREAHRGTDGRRPPPRKPRPGQARPRRRAHQAGRHHPRP